MRLSVVVRQSRFAGDRSPENIAFGCQKSGSQQQRYRLSFWFETIREQRFKSLAANDCSEPRAAIGSKRSIRYFGRKGDFRCKCVPVVPGYQKLKLSIFGIWDSLRRKSTTTP